MRTLDLHGVKHANVEDELANFFFWEYPNFKQYTIVTGNSLEMQKIVREWLDRHNYVYYIPSNNLGEIKVSE